MADMIYRQRREIPLQVRQVRKFSVAVGELLHLNAELAHHRHVQIPCDLGGQDLSLNSSEKR